MSKDEALKMAIEALKSSKRSHYYCEDTWYSCPKHEDGCANDGQGDECNCDADDVNAENEKAINACKEALEHDVTDIDVGEIPQGIEWQGLTDDEIDKIYFKEFDMWSSQVDVDFAHAIEQALKEKNT